MYTDVFKNAYLFIYRNARPVDLARWRFHFENEDREEALLSLSRYQNTDGGFGHGLEPDCLNPESSPVQTWAATEIIHELRLRDNTHPTVQSIMYYLDSGKDFADGRWPGAIESNNLYPCADWWKYDAGQESSYNPTAALAGFILKYGDKQGNLYKKAKDIAGEAAEAYLSRKPEDGGVPDMHLVSCYIRLWECCNSAEERSVIDLDRLLVQLKKDVHSCIEAGRPWGSGYVCRPSHFFRSETSRFYAGNEEAAQNECEFILNTQLDDGSWNVPWSWSEYPEQWAVSQNWWKAHIIIQNILYLNGFGYAI
ncbi:MAG: hypothetical protein LBL09_00540 [Oscillospiraceae bacterium]|jgi:hypothetical protein|nr:hypothetical protein [Oscillospiraceae bacterium]